MAGRYYLTILLFAESGCVNNRPNNDRISVVLLYPSPLLYLHFSWLWLPLIEQRQDISFLSEINTSKVAVDKVDIYFYNCRKLHILTTRPISTFIDWLLSADRWSPWKYGRLQVSTLQASHLMRRVYMTSGLQGAWTPTPGFYRTPTWSHKIAWILWLQLHIYYGRTQTVAFLVSSSDLRHCIIDLCMMI